VQVTRAGSDILRAREISKENFEIEKLMRGRPWDVHGARITRSEDNMRRSDLVRNAAKGKTVRTSQIVFGERQHLLRVLDSVERSALPAPRMEQERRVIEQLIHARTLELNRINQGWDEKVGVVLSAEVKPDTLDSLSKQAPKEDFYLLRLISEHPKVTAKTLGRLSHHPYSAIRENIARHPNSDAATLSRLSKDRTQPLWYLVAFNPNAPGPLRKKLQERMRRLGEKSATQ
jgi:hypothetical protein